MVNYQKNSEHLNNLGKAPRIDIKAEYQRDMEIHK